ncbi:MAG: FHA domain-containing protein [Acetobacterium sp.]|nr:FHA domain-containing protein [Acetobacterium sp.]
MKEKKQDKIKSDLVLMYDGKIYELNVSPFIIGRDPNSSDFYINNKTVSRNHGQLTQTDGSWYLEDLNSSSGTILNGVEIEPSRKYQIVAGDCLELSAVILDVLSVNTQPSGKANEDEYPDSQEQVEIKTEKQMKRIQGKQSFKNHSGSEGSGSSRVLKKDDGFREMNHFKSTLRQFLNENNLDQKAISRLKKIIELAQRLPLEETIFKSMIDEIMTEGVKKPLSYGSTVESVAEEKAPQVKAKIQKSQETLTTGVAHHGTAKIPVFHPVKVEGDWIEIPVSKIPFTIGRGPDNVDFVLRATGISRSHCLVSYHAGSYHISDLGSTNGILLNKKQLKPNDNYVIKNGDSVSFGVNQFYVEI